MHFSNIGKKFYPLLLVITLVSLSEIRCNAQDSEKTYSVEWLKNIPGSEDTGRTPLARRLENLIFGERPQQILKPVGVFLDRENNTWILSQGNGKVIVLRNGELRMPKYFRAANNILPSIVSACPLDSSGILITDSSKEMIYLLRGNEDLIEFCEKDILSRPSGIAYSESRDEIWVLESAGHRVSIFSRNGELIRRLGKRGSGNGEFNFPTHIWIGSNKLVYIVDALNFRTQIFNSNGEYLSSFGETGNATGKFARPKGIATDSHGNIYIADALFNSVQIFNREGKLLYYFGKSGSGNGEFMMPSGIFIDHNDYIYVSDSYNNRIQVFQLIEE